MFNQQKNCRFKLFTEFDVENVFVACFIYFKKTGVS